jgi:hypothetical protein
MKSRSHGKNVLDGLQKKNTHTTLNLALKTNDVFPFGISAVSQEKAKVNLFLCLRNTYGDLDE